MPDKALAKPVGAYWPKQKDVGRLTSTLTSEPN